MNEERWLRLGKNVNIAIGPSIVTMPRAYCDDNPVETVEETIVMVLSNPKVRIFMTRKQAKAIKKCLSMTLKEMKKK